MNLIALSSFVRVVDLGTVTAAAAAEGVPKSTISRRIARLEDELGVALLRRSARSIAVSDDGALVYERAAPAIRQLRAVQDDVAEAAGTPRGRLVVTAPNDLGRSALVAGLVHQYRTAFPEVQVEMRLGNRLMDLVAEGVDVGLRAHSGATPSGPGLMMKSLPMFEAGLYASPHYLATRGTPQTLDDLTGHDMVLMRMVEGLPLSLDRGDGGPAASFSPGEAAITANDFGFIQSMIARGGGLGLLPSFAALSMLKSGELVRLLPEYRLASGTLSIVWPESRHLSPKVRAFVDLAVEHLGRET